MNASDFHNALYESLPTLAGGTLCFWGDWFGRPYDNIHRVAGCTAIGDRADIFFDMGEALTIEEPAGWSFDNGHLIIAGARALRFNWFLYGERPGKESLRFLDYRRDGDIIRFETDFRPGLIEQTVDSSKPAVRMFGP